MRRTRSLPSSTSLETLLKTTHFKSRSWRSVSNVSRAASFHDISSENTAISMTTPESVSPVQIPLAGTHPHGSPQSIPSRHPRLRRHGLKLGGLLCTDATSESKEQKTSYLQTQNQHQKQRTGLPRLVTRPPSTQHCNHGQVIMSQSHCKEAQDWWQSSCHHFLVFLRFWKQ